MYDTIFNIEDEKDKNLAFKNIYSHIGELVLAETTKVAYIIKRSDNE